MGEVCIVAMLKWEEAFVDEWIIYHRMLGFDHFFLYDDPALPLKNLLQPYSDYVTVIDWGNETIPEGQTRQLMAYNHALKSCVSDYEWVLFIDGDEFVTLRRHENVKDYLSEFTDSTAVSLNWLVFGHNGYYDDSDGLITSSLTRRMYLPSINVKSFNRVKSIDKIDSAHFCRSLKGRRKDANNNDFQNQRPHPGLAFTAHINHYQCHSFKTWMKRPSRGRASNQGGEIPKEKEWQHSEEACLRQFVMTVAKDKNEYVDQYMLKYKDFLERKIEQVVELRKSIYG